MKNSILLTLLTLLIGSTVFAQNNDEYHKNEFYGGFSHLRLIDKTDIEDDEVQTPNLNGFNAAYTRNVHKYLGIKFQASGHYVRLDYPMGNPSYYTRNLHTLTGGIQFKNNSKKGKIKPFAHALIGYGLSRSYFQQNSSSNGQIISQSRRNVSSWAGVFGGGLDIKVNHRFSVRVIQLDYVRANPSPGFESGNFQIGAGIIIH